MIDLRDHYKATPEYKNVYRKASFAAWTLAIDTLAAWGVLLPEVVDAFRKLEVLRNRSIHFNPETVSQLRDDALLSIRHLQGIITGQFAAFGLQPWFIEGTLGAGFIKRDWEENPFVRHYVLPGNVCLGPFHNIIPSPNGVWMFVDHPDYGAFGVEDLTDEQFKDIFNDRPMEALAQLPAEAASDGSET
jgi:hypothetical protein